MMPRQLLAAICLMPSLALAADLPWLTMATSLASPPATSQLAAPAAKPAAATNKNERYSWLNPEYQWHGFLAQGVVLTSRNNFFGDSRDASLQYTEAGLNLNIGLGQRMHVSAQGLVRRAGELDDGSLELDYAVLDLKALNNAKSDVGLRLGRVRNPFGLYNETRDVPFTRPGILLPQSVYQDGQGLRDLNYASDGGQLYAIRRSGQHTTRFHFNAGGMFKASDELERNLATVNFPGSLRFQDNFVGRLMHEWGGLDQYRLAISASTSRFSADVSNPIFGNFRVAGHLRAAVVSAQYRAARWRLTAEYIISEVTISLPLFSAKVRGDGAFLQAEYRINRAWSLLGRYDTAFVDRNDRDGRGAVGATTTGGGVAIERHSRFSRDWTLGATWRITPQWSLWGEFHYIDGTRFVPAVENRGRHPARYWTLSMLMLGWRF